VPRLTFNPRPKVTQAEPAREMERERERGRKRLSQVEFVRLRLEPKKNDRGADDRIERRFVPSAPAAKEQSGRGYSSSCLCRPSHEVFKIVFRTLGMVL